MHTHIETLKKDMIHHISAAKSAESLKEVEVKYFGKNGLFNGIMRQLKDLSDDEKRTIGKLANETKQVLEARVSERYLELEDALMANLAESEWMDVTVPGAQPIQGHRHVLTQFMDEVEAVFARMGFSVADGPEVEEEHYNFDQLNIPANHPARDMQDTFWVANLPRHVLRTQTSSVQIRHMETHQPPVRIITMGKTFRKDSDATHSPMFHQLEGLMVDTDISMAHLKAVITEVLQQIFEDDSIKTRFRISYFPFVEPGMEADCTCPICHGSGKLNNGVPCRLCKQTGWLEILGAGMVHPQVLKNAGYDPEQVTGFAFGMGLDRMAMIKHRINHLRLLFENDLRFIEQF
ncbi:phenylalanine--tRNA ligase subunit alpha [Candidatus Peregrinibacteria bacterium]|nr:MAG: phenylalanine--tRNA ligase subunit alpha [Candidatus Peregrinibacteria bacterium]